jgi:hypothetical protein
MKAAIPPENITVSSERLHPENFERISQLVQAHSHVVCCVGRTKGAGINNIDYLETRLNENIRDNMYSQLLLSQLCQKWNVHLTCLNTGCIFSPGVYGETEVPNFTSSAYSTVKLYLDQFLNHQPGTLNIRIKMPITDDRDGRSLINKLLKFNRVTNLQNSMTYIPEMFPWLVQMMIYGFTGCYNLVNRGTISNAEIVTMYRELVDREHKFTVDDTVSVNRSNSTLLNEKLERDLKIVTKDIKDCIRTLFLSPVYAKPTARLAIVLRGISYYDGAEAVCRSAKLDYRECLESFRENLLAPLGTLFGTIDIYCVTYSSSMLSQLLQDFKPKDSSISPVSTMNKHDRNHVVSVKILESLNLVEDNIRERKEQYDNILLTRFDLFYYQKFRPEKLRLNMVNFGWVGEQGQSDDNFLLFEPRHIPRIREYVSRSNGYMHGLIHAFPGESHALCHLDPHNGYHQADFYVFQRFKSGYKDGNSPECQKAADDYALVDPRCSRVFKVHMYE